MKHYLFKPKKRDVVQYIIVLAVVTIILAFAFPKIRDKMGITTKTTTSSIDIGLGNMFSNAPTQYTYDVPQSDIDWLKSNYDDYQRWVRPSHPFNHEYYIDLKNVETGKIYRCHFLTIYPANFTVNNGAITSNVLFWGFVWFDGIDNGEGTNWAWFNTPQSLPNFGDGFTSIYIPDNAIYIDMGQIN